jgi:hypothetical protein
MFNDKYYLTQSTLDGYKTNTRRIEPCCKFIPDAVSTGYKRPEFVGDTLRLWKDESKTFIEFKTRYQVDEVVAIAQSYEDADTGWIKLMMNNRQMYDAKKHKIIQGLNDPIHPCAGLGNKMFVKADLMPHQIKFTGIKLEQLQDISDEDSLKEGIFYYDGYIGAVRSYDNPREAFASIIDKISGKYTWKSNPYVIAYEFEVIK